MNHDFSSTVHCRQTWNEKGLMVAAVNSFTLCNLSFLNQIEWLCIRASHCAFLLVIKNKHLFPLRYLFLVSKSISSSPRELDWRAMCFFLRLSRRTAATLELSCSNQMIPIDPKEKSSGEFIDTFSSDKRCKLWSIS